MLAVVAVLLAISSVTRGVRQNVDTSERWRELTSFGGDDGGCSATGCFGNPCDYWVASASAPDSCSLLEGDGCDCSGCCAPTATPTVTSEAPSVTLHPTLPPT
jgi:hypothetical protein